MGGESGTVELVLGRGGDRHVGGFDGGGASIFGLGGVGIRNRGVGS